MASRAEPTRPELRMWALADRSLAPTRVGQTVGLYPTREEAEEALREVLADEPGWRDDLNVLELRIAELSPN